MFSITDSVPGRPAGTLIPAPSHPSPPVHGCVCTCGTLKVLDSDHCSMRAHVSEDTLRPWDSCPLLDQDLYFCSRLGLSGTATGPLLIHLWNKDGLENVLIGAGEPQPGCRLSAGCGVRWPESSDVGIGQRCLVKPGEVWRFFRQLQTSGCGRARSPEAAQARACRKWSKGVQQPGMWSPGSRILEG